MVPWFGNYEVRNEVRSLDWHETTWLERIGFLLKRQPMYRFKTRHFDEDTTNIDSLKDLVKQMSESGFRIEAQRGTEHMWEFTRFVALDQTTINCMLIMK